MIAKRSPQKLLLIAVGALTLIPAASLRAQTQAAPVLTEQEKAIVSRIKTIRSVPDDKRGAVTREIALSIRKLPPDAVKVSIANGLAGRATEGDFGHDTLQEVAVTLADALKEQPAAKSAPYDELAQLIRYEHVDVALDSPQLKNALSKLQADDQDREHADFTLNDLAGKPWTLKDLHGKVVLVNFWATWCPPCRKEMPDLDTLYKRFHSQGLVVLSISDEDAATVNPYLAAHRVTYPVLLDPGRKVNTQFHVEGIPKSFVYNREGKLVAQSIDMRTQAQFLAMLNEAGLK